MTRSIEESERGLKLHADFFYRVILEFIYGCSCALAGRFDEGHAVLQDVVADCEEIGGEAAGWPAAAMLGMVLVVKGQMTKGLRMLSDTNVECLRNDVKQPLALGEYLCGMLYANLAAPTNPIKVSLLVKNIGFIMRHAPFAMRKAVFHYRKAIEVSQQCGFNSQLGMVYLELGRLYKNKGKKELARQNLTAAVRLCKECEASGSLKQAEELLAALNQGS